MIARARSITKIKIFSKMYTAFLHMKLGKIDDRIGAQLFSTWTEI